MRIGILSTLARTVPPPAEGSVELLVSHLADYLAGRGHEVTLFALPGSKTQARLVSPVESSYVGDLNKWDWQLYEAFQVKEAFSRWHEFDVINCHSYYHGLMHADNIPIPSIHSFHVDPGPDYVYLARRTHNRHLHFCSSYQARDFEGIDNVHIISHGIDVNLFAHAPLPASPEYLAWIGRFHPEKGVLQAIELARMVEIPLKLAGPENAYFRTEVLPQLDGKQVIYIGEVSGAAKAEFLANALALLYPVQRGEPFGLVLIEAMAAGLPVIATNLGAVPEIINPGVTGYIGATPAQLIQAIDRTALLDRNRIRDEACRKFSIEAMGGNMEKLMLKVHRENLS